MGIDTLRDVLERLRYGGDRLVQEDGTMLYAGLGNRSGLHGFADTLVRQKWERSSAGLRKKLRDLKEGTILHVQMFRNKTRDRGTWSTVRKIVVGPNWLTLLDMLLEADRG